MAAQNDPIMQIIQYTSSTAEIKSCILLLQQ